MLKPRPIHWAILGGLAWAAPWSWGAVRYFRGGELVTHEDALATATMIVGFVCGFWIALHVSSRLARPRWLEETAPPADARQSKRIWRAIMAFVSGTLIAQIVFMVSVGLEGFGSLGEGISRPNSSDVEAVLLPFIAHQAMWSLPGAGLTWALTAIELRKGGPN